MIFKKVKELEKTINNQKSEIKYLEDERDRLERHYDRQNEDLRELELLIAVISEIYDIKDITITKEDRERLQYKSYITITKTEEKNYQFNLPKKKVGRPKKAGKQ